MPWQDRSRPAEARSLPVRACVRAMRAYEPPLEERTGIRLDFNENTRGCSPTVLAAIRSMDGRDIAQYPSYRALLTTISRTHGLDIASVLLTNGADDALRVIMDACVSAGDTILLLSPSFSVYQTYASLREAVVRWVPYEDSFAFPFTSLQDALRSQSPRLCIIANPNNPTGTTITPQALLGLTAANPATLFIIDEAYADFSGQTCLSLPRPENMFIIRSLSKSYGLAGLRLGFLVAAPAIATQLRKAASPYAVNVMAVKAGIAALEDRQYLRSSVKEVIENRSWLRAQLGVRGIHSYPSEANFLLVSNSAIGRRRVSDILSSRGIRTRRFPELGCIRVTIGTAQECEMICLALDGRDSRGAPDAGTLLFDLDGTLIDISASYWEAIRQTVTQFTGRIVSDDEITVYKSKGGMNNEWDLTQTILSNSWTDATRRITRTPPSRETIIAAFQQAYWDDGRGLILQEKLLAPIALLSSLRTYFRLGLVTGRPRRETSFTLRRFGIQELFSTIICMEECARQKPDPCGLRQAMSATPGPWRYIGDCVDDMRAAARAGIPCIGITTATRAQALRFAGAAATYPSVIALGKDLMELVELRQCRTPLPSYPPATRPASKRTARGSTP
ncbi:hypothetical protein AUJ68_05900 [Candidatus Woesearchaeota archaeon CG1_02_57_44]|nr:MAG: hypothetical protein AUJ68_05900 [Candidatus Woesearchaeota archaeon CG1_02_57_44]